MGNISIFIAFFAGVASFISPCTLPLIPVYINLLMNNEKISKKDIIFRKSITFILGFTLIFIIMGASVTFLGRVFNNNLEIFRIIAGLLIIIFGIYTLEIIKIGSIYKQKSFIKNGERFGPFVMGIAFAIGWTPCVGPILGSVLVYTSTVANLNGILMLAFYSLGLGVPFLICAMAIEKFSVIRKYIFKYMNLIRKITGVLMILIGLLILTNKLVVLIGFLV